MESSALDIKLHNQQKLFHRNEQLINLNIEEKLSYIDKIMIKTPQMGKIIETMEKCHNSSRYMDKPQCMTIFGESGAGKTTLYKIYKMKHPDTEFENYTKKTIFYSPVPCPAYIGTLPNSMLKNLGDPFYSKRGNILSQSQRLFMLLKACKVEVIVIDEVQHLVDRNSQKLIRDSSDWYKTLIDEVSIPIVFMGLPDSERIFIENSQLGTRVRFQNTIKAFEYNEDFIKFLHIFDYQLPFRKSSNFSSADLSKKIFDATNGLMRNIKDLILEASNISLHLNASNILPQAFKEAYDRLFLDTKNIFN